MHRTNHSSDLTSKTVKSASRKSLRHRFRDEAGATIVEFTLVMVFLFLPVMTSVVALSWIMNQYLELTNAVNLGAAALAESRGYTTDPCLTAEEQAYAVAPMLSPANLTFQYTFGTMSSSGVFTPTSGASFNGGGAAGKNDASGCSATGSTGASANMVAGNWVRVYGTYACGSPFGAMGMGWLNSLASGCHLTAVITQVIQ